MIGSANVITDTLYLITNYYSNTSIYLSLISSTQGKRFKNFAIKLVLLATE